MIRIAILGAGGIAHKLARTMKSMENGPELYAVASRDKAKAEAFAAEFGVEKAYGAYEEMLKDDRVDAVYVATPHSHHYQHIMMCLEHGKHVLCEKAFTVNAKQAEEVCAKAREKGLVLAEAIWTRYMPSRAMIDRLMADGEIGEPRVLNANLCYKIDEVPRIYRPELAGGALLDVGVYTLNFASMAFGDDIARIDSSVVKFDTGVDKQESITLHYADGKMAVLTASSTCIGDRHGVIFGTKGWLAVDNINNPIVITRCVGDRVETFTVPAQLSGYEYEISAFLDAIERRLPECPAMPHAEIVRIMSQMDALRAQWDIVLPCE